MWFVLPEGCSGISVERQEFSPEFKDEEGKCYFRAPDHFAPLILAVKGFERVDAPKGAPEDLPKADPVRDGAIAQLTATVEAQKTEIRNLREDLSVASARVVALSNERTDLLNQIAKAEARITSLEEELEDKPSVELTGKKK